MSYLVPFEKPLNVLTDDWLLINSLLKQTTDKILNCLLRLRFIMVAENASFRNGILLKRILNVIVNDRPMTGATKP